MKVKSNSTETTFDVTLHDRIGRGTTVDKDEGTTSPDGGIFTGRSYHCESLTLFMAILTAGFYLNSPILKGKKITLTFKFSKRLFGSGLVESVKKCSGKPVSADKDPVKENIYNFNISSLTEYSDKAAAAPNDHYKPQQRIYDKKLRIVKCSTKPNYLGSCTGKTEGFFKVDFDSDTTVGNLKSVILDELKIPFDNQYLLFNANETSVELTDNNRTLQSYGIINNDSRIEFYVLTADEAKDAADPDAVPPEVANSDNPPTDPLINILREMYIAALTKIIELNNPSSKEQGEIRTSAMVVVDNGILEGINKKVKPTYDNIEDVKKYVMLFISNMTKNNSGHIEIHSLQSIDDTNYCTALSIFLEIILYIRSNVFNSFLMLKSTPSFLKQTKKCLNKPNKPHITSFNELLGGRSRRKSNTTHRHKHNRKTHSKHARKTRHKRGGRRGRSYTKHARKTHHKRGGRRMRSYAKHKHASKSHKCRK